MRQIKKAALLLAAALLCGCGAKASSIENNKDAAQEATVQTADGAAGEKEAEAGAENADEAPSGTETDSVLSDGTYTAEFKTDSSMFHVNESCDGKGTLTVKNGEMSIHISLVSKNIVNLYPGLAEDAQKEGAGLLEPTTDTVTYSDGMTEEVYGFDVPVPALDEEFDLALLGAKGVWYDHKVSVSNPVEKTASMPEDGTYVAELSMEGGSGKASIKSPAEVTIAGGKATAVIEWSSPNYDYMIVEGVKYLPVNTEGNSVFEIPVATFDEPVTVIADTVAMSKPHEIEYRLTFHSKTMKPHSGSSTARNAENGDPAELQGLSFVHSMELGYANNFRVDYYKGGYVLLTTVTDGSRFLIVPEGKQLPEGLEKGITVLQRPIKNLYLVSSAVMDIFDALDGLEAIAFSGQKQDGWYIQSAREAMADGKIVYAGKYNRPDYEQILAGGCTLAIENTMVTHSPEVVEKLESFGIPVMIEYSSYESHPLGRAEWVRFFGALLGKEQQADDIMEEQAEILKRVISGEKTGKTVGFFYITSNGLMQVRRSTDYIPKMIELAGGGYLPKKQEDTQSVRSTMNMQVEDFYQAVKDADYLIYNSTIDNSVSSLGDLLDKCRLLSDFKAVREGNVWCMSNDTYQQPLSAAYLIEDFHAMLSGGQGSQMHYLFPLE